jgi:phosphonate transport system substrate-binding protein
MLKILLVCIFLLNSVLFAKDVLIFAPLPMVDRTKVYNTFYPMIQVLEKKLNKKIEIFYSDDYDQILEEFKKSKIDIAYLGPLPYVKLKENYDFAYPLIHFKDQSGSSLYTCSFVRFLDNQKIEKIALTQPLSTCGYLSVNNLLDNKLEDYKYKYLGKHDEVALSILRGDFDAGGLKTSVAKEYFHLGLEEISKTPNLPGFAIVGNLNSLGIEYLEEIKKNLLEIEEDIYSKWDKDIKYGVEPAYDKDYENLRKMMKNIIIQTKDKN